MPFQLTYRLEFQNFEENIIRIDISESAAPITPGGSLSIPANVGFNVGPPNQILILSYTGSFFYVGMTFTVTGSVSNNSTFTVVSILQPGVSTQVNIAETVTNEYVGTGPVVFTDISTTSPQLVTLIGTGTPLVISTINNDQDKFQPIRSKQAVIQFISQGDQGLDISTFSTGADNRWAVTISIVGGDIIFLGFLIMSDNQQPFQPDPQTVQLTATDHLGALKDIALVDLFGNNPMGAYRIADLITIALKTTGMALDLYVTNNLRAGSGQLITTTSFITSGSIIAVAALITFFYPGQEITVSGTASNDGTYHVVDVASGILTLVQVYEFLVDESGVSATFNDTASPNHIYDGTYLDAKTFEDQIGSCINAYDTLARILGEDCWIGQYKGNWWIMRVDEFDSNLIYVAHFTSGGKFDATASGTTYNISVGAVDTRRFADANQLLQFIRPHGYVKETIDYQLPLEIPCNKDFSRGTVPTTIVSASEKHFDLDCWDRLWSNTSTDDPSTAGITFLRRDYINDIEISRYVQISVDPLGHLNFIMSERVPVNMKDKFNIDFSVRTSTNIGGSGFYRINAMQVRLYGEDGTFWTLYGKTSVNPLPLWVECDSTFRTNQKYLVMEGDLSTTDFTQSQALFSGESAQIPVNGYLRILIYANTEDVTARATYIDNLTFDYLPLVNGSYQKFIGDYNRVDRTASGYMAKRDNQVYIADLPVKLYKGALMIISRYQEFLSDSTTFAAPNAFAVPGNQTTLFYPGQLIRIIGTSMNDQLTKVTAVIYHTIGDVTEIQVVGAIATETSTAGFSEAILELTHQWYSAAPLALALNTDPANLHSFGYIQAYSVWNQFRGFDDADGNGSGINIFTGSVLGLTTDWPDIIHKYILSDTNAQTNNRYFVLISMSQDWRSCIWTATFIECFNTITGRIYTDPQIFRYISQ